jgi:hypothetical protein
MSKCLVEIKHRYTGAVLYAHETTAERQASGMAMRDALEAACKARADLADANLARANLADANLADANLARANLADANLADADLVGADLAGANLARADLVGADLAGANLARANLADANLADANLARADLVGADLVGADLAGANLARADLVGADLAGAKNADLVIARTRILPDGDLIGWKKCRNDVIVKLRIPADAKRSHAFGRKCRAEFADVLEIIGAKTAISKHDESVIYAVGQRVTAHEWCDNWQEECAGGIHFFITRAEAEAY